jgi:hypothetical protein
MKLLQIINFLLANYCIFEYGIFETKHIMFSKIK